MLYTQLGRSGLTVSRLCLGTMNFGPHTEEADARAIMDSAVDAGINFFDTANVYGGTGHRGRTEEILGRWFATGGQRRDGLCWRRNFMAPWRTGPTNRGCPR